MPSQVTPAVFAALLSVGVATTAGRAANQPSSPPSAKAQSSPAANAPTGQPAPVAQRGDAADAHHEPGFGPGAPRGSTGLYGKTDAATETTALHRSDRDWLQKMADEAQAQFAAAQLAVERAQDPRVRAFAQRFGQHRRALTEAVMPLLRTHNVPVENDLKSDRVYRSLSDANNEHFDRKFLDTLIGWYEGDLKHLESAAQESENPELRQFASQQAGPLQDELKAARELRENLSK